MMAHKRKHEKDELFSCKYCKFMTKNIDELDEHIQLHEDFFSVIKVEEEEQMKKIEEDIVNKEIEINHEIVQYEKSKKVKKDAAEEYTKDVWHKCSLCSYKTKRKHDMPKHFITHCNLNTTTVYHCSECNYETKRKNDMPKHMLGHCTEGVPMYKCSECPYQTKRKNDLPKHLLCHKTPDAVHLWYCSQCSYYTKRKGDLNKHELNHLSRDQLEEHHCTECKYVTKRKNDLNKHMLVHCDRHVEGYFKCLKCHYATDKIHKFAKHVLSKCSYWQDPKNLDHINLEDMLNNADKEGVHLILANDEEECYVELDDEFEEITDENFDTTGGHVEVVNESHDVYGNHTTCEDENTNEEHHYVEYVEQFEHGEKHANEHHQYIYMGGNENMNKRDDGNKIGNAIFNLNLGEFIVDADPKVPSNEQ